MMPDRHESTVTLTLVEKQHLFTQLVARLIEYAAERGYGVAFGDAWRSPEEAERLSNAGRGSARSLHCERLAIDLVLRTRNENGTWTYLSATEDYAILGTEWKRLHDLCRWGGDFSRPDGNHFALTHDGRA